MPEDSAQLTESQEFSSSEFPTDHEPQQFDELVAVLSALVGEVEQRRPGIRGRGGPPQHDLPGNHLEAVETCLTEAYRFFRETASQDLSLTSVSEWVLDNYYIIRQALAQIHEDLPPGFYQQLPKLTGTPLHGFPRVYVLAHGILSSQNLLLNPLDLQTILIHLQENIPLSMGELWALPIFLRYDLVDTLADGLQALIHPGQSSFVSLSSFWPPDDENLAPSQGGIPVSGQALRIGDGDNPLVANIILSLRAISEQDWNDFFESVSRTEKTLRMDPGLIYPRMDFKTRDLYRKEIEALSFATSLDENRVAEISIDLAQASSDRQVESPNLTAAAQTDEVFEGNSSEQEEDSFLKDHRTHIGEYLLGEGRALLEERLGYHPDFGTVLKRWVRRQATFFYLFSIFVIVLGMLGFVGSVVNLPALYETTFLTGSRLFGSEALFMGWAVAQTVLVALLTIALLIAGLTVASNLVNWLITLWMAPRILPKLNFKNGIPDSFRTLVVIPALITSREEIESLVQQLEMHYLRNPEPGLLFGLLTDFSDADSETLPGDEGLVGYASAAIERLNEKHAGSGHFFFFHRKRQWNPSEGKWMGWERKRGKLHELNLLLRGQKSHSFSTLVGSPEPPCGGQGNQPFECVRFVITLDADTILPPGAGRRLVGTLAHPLNRARFDPTAGRVTSGYTVLQPRMEIHPRSANHSWFTRIFAGDTGLDLYTHAVSDAYQDLFREGSYVGKGIYDVDAFERSVDGHIPENTVLSHDLLEGLMGRAGLVTDITMVEDYPQDYFVQVMRQRRWIRGDWQLLPWLFRPGSYGIWLSAIDRWKVIDNLLRSMLAPALTAVMLLGLMTFPSLALLWVMVVLITYGIPLFTSLASTLLKMLAGGLSVKVLRPLRWNLLRWLLAVAFLPYEAFVALDAVLTTLNRLFISRRKLLQWTTAAQTTRLFGSDTLRKTVWLKLAASSLLAVVVVLLIAGVGGFAGAGPGPGLLAIVPVLLWALSPLIAQRINRPFVQRLIPADFDRVDLIRQIGRRTWGFFERFASPEDHWLPPDNFQESPLGRIAHHTSPTNIGLLLTSTLAAYDLGYIDQLTLATRLGNTIDALDQLDRFRGHFMNWYDTITLQPLHPRYISTVDSGNLAACLIITAQACQAFASQPAFRWELWLGYLDSLSSLTDSLAGMLEEGRVRSGKERIEEIIQHVARVREEILAVENEPRLWYGLYQKVSGPYWKDFSRRLIGLLEMTHSVLDLEALRRMQELSSQVEQHHKAVQRAISELVPWIPLFERLPEVFKQQHFAAELSLLRANLSYNPPINQIRACTEAAQANLNTLRRLLNGPGIEIETQEPISTAPPLNGSAKPAGLDWLDDFERAFARANENADMLIERFAQISRQVEQYFNEMDFAFLYHPQRRVFHLGFNLDTGRLDHNYYDLLASEARISSLIAIARGEVPLTHWMQLGRPMTEVGASHVLLSWSATMFEYLMPPLFLGSYSGTLLADSALGAVVRQIAYAKEKEVPWGISESGFYQFDNNQNYQYRAFGVPGLGFKRGLADDLVIAPYASLMAISYDPQAVVDNLKDLLARGMQGRYGFFEAIDFTADRMALGETSAIIREYMAHHQGMIMMAIDNFLHANIMVERMHSDIRIQSVDLLLQEQVPNAVPLQDPSAQDYKGISKLPPSAEKIQPWNIPVQTPIPEVHLLSNGSYSVLISNMGGGYSRWRDVDLTRWQPDEVLDPWGSWIYLQELGAASSGDNRLWSASFQPIPASADDMQVTYMAHMAVFRRRENEITSTMEITVAHADPVEIRRVHLYNTSDRPRQLRLTSYGEVILSKQMSDARHPAFNKLFIESEFVPELNLQIFKRRPRSSLEKPIFLGHMLVLDGAGQAAEPAGQARHEADRRHFIGRCRSTRSPAALSSDEYLSGSSGATLDPIFALGYSMTIMPHQSSVLAYITLAGESREAIMALASRYRRWDLVERSYRQAEINAEAWLSRQNLNTRALQDYLQVLSALIFPFKAVRADAETLSANRLGQSGLWRFGISGDYPILLVELEDPGQVDLAREALQVQKFLRQRGFLADVVFLNRQQTNYGAELRGRLFRLTRQVGSDQLLNQRGGVFILHADQMNREETVLLLTSARLALSGSKGTLGDQLPGYSIQVHHLPEFAPTRMVEEADIPGEGRLPEGENLQFFNGYGGFSPDGCEYVISLPAGKATPAPWVNVIGYPHFGFLVTESGGQCTWSLNSGENRLTPWYNDPVSDLSGEALYLRDEETGAVWSPTPLPASSGQPYRVTHGAGYTLFEHESQGLAQSLTLFASPEDPVKIIHLRVQNTLERVRRVTATQYVEWVLGTSRTVSSAYVQPEYDPDHECLLAANPYNQEFGSRTAFLIASKPVHGRTADRAEFLGRAGTMASPASLRRLGLETRIMPGDDPCAVLQVHLDLQPGAVEEIYFVLGQGNTREHAISLANKYHNPAYVGAARERTRVFWDSLLDTIQVHTPEPALDLILNRWLLYQTLSCRVWGRTGFYQSSGAFGFRDQLQDVLALLAVDPIIARGQILNAAHRQFEAGDVLHWWHPPSGRGVRTRFSDDLLWLPYVTTQYIEVTGDMGILSEEIPFLQAPPLKQGEEELYGEFPSTGKSYPLMEHCRRALEIGATKGPHGLPLIGAGDWNDGMNRVGEGGKGESVWLAWFLCDVLQRFAALCEGQKDHGTAERYRALARDYAAAVERSAWDGAWYRRAFYDDGTPLGSSQSQECKIDAIAQSWAVLSGSGDVQRSSQAMQSVMDHLVRPEDRLVLLFTPPFDQTDEDPGYIKGYLPGIRENGGQYTHAAIWTTWAFTSLGDGNRAGELIDLLNPILQSDTEEKARVYRNEPYVICADIYSMPPYIRRGGWTWYTGSAAWMYRLGLEALLGIRKKGDFLYIQPVIPASWGGFEVTYRFGKAHYQIKVSRQVHPSENGRAVTLDGTELKEAVVPLVDDGKHHQVVLTL